MKLTITQFVPNGISKSWSVPCTVKKRSRNQNVINVYVWFQYVTIFFNISRVFNISHVVSIFRHQQIVVCALHSKEEEQKSKSTWFQYFDVVAFLCLCLNFGTCQLCLCLDYIPLQNKITFNLIFFTCSSSKRQPGEGERLSVVPRRSFSTFGHVF